VKLNPQQETAAAFPENAVVTACPGSGKTRVLIAKLIKSLSALESPKRKIVALTFTNRAADEIKSRLDVSGTDSAALWAGTIHSFALEWILRPYAPYLPQLSRGFTTADEYESERILSALKKDHGLEFFDKINTQYDREGHVTQKNSIDRQIFESYKRQLYERKLLDYDDILYFAYRLVSENTEIAGNLARMLDLVCVDEMQDIQDLQYGVLSKIFRATSNPFKIFLVGDEDQSIYETLGSITKNPQQVAEEFGLPQIEHLTLDGNYRSTQRIVDFFSRFGSGASDLTSLADYKDEAGTIRFENQSISRSELPEVVAGLIRQALDSGIPDKEICVIAPQWTQVKEVTRSLIQRLPDVEFDAPGLSPLYGTRENIWFRVARLFLTEPSPRKSRIRIRWANELIAELIDFEYLPEIDPIKAGRKLLRMMNAIISTEEDGLCFLRDCFEQFEEKLGVCSENVPKLKELKESFFAKAFERISNQNLPIPSDTVSFRRLFNHPSGVVVNTCHGVKGEEYETVIALGLLDGYLPHWEVLSAQGKSDSWKKRQQSNMLYVICSRSKKNLYLISESGRKTQRQKPYQTTTMLRGLDSGLFD